MNLVFFGTPQAAVGSLEALVEAGHRVVAVVSQPDRAAGRSRKPQAPPVKRSAEALGLDVLQPTRLREERFLEDLRERSPELLVVVAYGRILRRGLRELAPGGAVNLHFSLLPRYRGAAPVQWALARGETVTGVTTMRIARELDAGDLLLQREVEIGPEEHCPALQARLAAIGARLLVETVERLAAGSIDPRPQDPAEATFAPLLSPADGDLDLDLRAVDVENRIRGFDPWPGVWADRSGARVRLVRARALDEPGASPPGTIVDLGRQRIGLVCAEKTVLRLLEVQFQGRRASTAEDAVRGRRIAPGDVLS